MVVCSQIINVNESPDNLVLHHSEVFENQPGGTLVGILTASDPEGNRIQFKIERDQAGVFKVSYRTRPSFFVNTLLFFVVGECSQFGNSRCSSFEDNKGSRLRSGTQLCH